ncbi:MAG: RlmE family RNA methyltransferase [Acidiferrobacterales bacterium]
MTSKRRSRTWWQRHASDAFVRRARTEGYRSRAAYKLIELDERFGLFRPGMTVVDLGAAPGGWAQYVRRQVGTRGHVLAQDLLPMEPLSGVEFIHGDIGDPTVLDLVIERLSGRAVDLVISDIAPNISGDRVSDQMRAIGLGGKALALAVATLKPGGGLLLKTFQGEGFSDLRQALQQHFDKVLTCKPRASHARSREIYLFGKDFQDRGEQLATQGNRL